MPYGEEIVRPKSLGAEGAFFGVCRAVDVDVAVHFLAVTESIAHAEVHAATG